MSRRTWRVVFALAVMVTLVLMLVPLKANTGGIPHTDKVAHIIVFAVLGFIGGHAWPQRLLVVAAGLVLYGPAIEVLQSLMPSRTASVADAVGDWAGVALGLWIARARAFRSTSLSR